MPLPTPVAVEKPTYTVQRGTVIKTLEFTGRVSPVTEQELFFKTAGYVRAVYVARGDDVQAGDLLAELEIGDLENQLAQAQVALQTAETNLTQAQQEIADALAEAEIALEKSKIRLEQAQVQDVNSAVTIARIGLEQATATLADAQKAYDQAWDSARDWELYMTEPTFPYPGAPVATGPPLSEQLKSERDFTERNLATSQSSLEISQAGYNQAISAKNAHNYDVQTYQQDLALAELQVEQLERRVDPLLELNVEKARLDIQRLEDQMEEAQLVASFDGQVLSLNVKAGSYAEAFKVALILGDPADLEITADLGADDLSAMSVGQPATIRLRSRPESDLNGYVRQLPYPYSGGSAGADDDDTVTRIALDDSTVELELGELATVVIVLEQKDDVLWLPPAALRTYQGRDFVVIQDGDVQRMVDVRMGIKSEERVEILEGVEEGQIVVGP